jgi:twitching motility protein PilT
MTATRGKRIDAYVNHLQKHNAREVVLESGKPALFRFPAGDRSANTKIPHEALQALVREVATAANLTQLEHEARTSFRYSAGSGGKVKVSVFELEGRGWRIRITPDVEDMLELDIGQGDGLDLSALTKQTEPRIETKNRTVRMSKTPAARKSKAPGSRKSKAPKSLSPRKSKAPTSRKSRAPRSGGPAQIDRYLRMLIEKEGSDLHLSANQVPLARIHGEIQPLDPGHPELSDAKLRKILFEVATPRAEQHFNESSDADFAYNIEGLARFRANYFEDRFGMCAVFRQIPIDIIPPDKLGLPKSVLDLCWLSKGLVVVTGPTGSGKSTTLAALIDYINRNRAEHIITIEDPIEFVHENKKCLVNQREVGTHTEGFKKALRAALREDPDIVLVGEMRDLETIAIAIETAETGHLVFGTLHTTTAASTVDRIIDQFPADRQAQIRTMLSESLRGVIAQVLCKKVTGGRVAAYEVLITNTAISNLIREGKTYQLTSTMQTGRGKGMQTLNDHLFTLVKSKRVHPREAYIKAADKSAFRELLNREGIELKLD